VRAYVVAQRDGHRGAVWEDIAEPVPGDSSVVVRVRAAALAWSDILQVAGTYAGAVPNLPFTCGHEFAGEIVSAAKGCGYSAGERVFGFLASPGAFAEYVAAPLASIRRTPTGMPDAAAAAFTTSFLTADVALVTAGGLRPGGSVLIHAAAGGVGKSAVQLAAAMDARLILATAGAPARRIAAEAAGATATAGYDDFPGLVAERTAGRGVDVVLESIGGEVFDHSLEVLAPMGRLVTIGASGGVPPRRLKLPRLWQQSISVCGIHIGRLLAEEPRLLAPSWDRLLTLLADGRIKPEVGLVIAPAEISKGMDVLRGRQAEGRVVIDFTRGRP